MNRRKTMKGGLVLHNRRRSRKGQDGESTSPLAVSSLPFAFVSPKGSKDHLRAILGFH